MTYSNFNYSELATQFRPQTREVMEHAIFDLVDRGYSDYEIAAISKLSVALVRQVIASRCT